MCFTFWIVVCMGRGGIVVPYGAPIPYTGQVWVLALGSGLARLPLPCGCPYPTAPPTPRPPFPPPQLPWAWVQPLEFGFWIQDSSDSSNSLLHHLNCGCVLVGVEYLYHWGGTPALNGQALAPGSGLGPGALSLLCQCPSPHPPAFGMSPATGPRSGPCKIWVLDPGLSGSSNDVYVPSSRDPFWKQVFYYLHMWCKIMRFNVQDPCKVADNTPEININEWNILNVCVI